MSVGTVLLLVACVLFLMAAVGWPDRAPFQLGWLGAFFFTLANLIGAFG